MTEDDKLRFHKLLDELRASNMQYEWVSQAVGTATDLANDDAWPDNHRNRHYFFDNMAQEAFTDVILKYIADSLRKSKKAKGITLFHGNITDKGMRSFLDALKETKAPISNLEFCDLRGVTDISLQELPTIIKLKHITKCDVSGLVGISDNLKKEIAKATASVRKMNLNKVTNKLKSANSEPLLRPKRYDR